MPKLLIANEIMQVLNKEILWCEQHPSPDETFHPEYRKGFVNGLIQAKYLIAALAAIDAPPQPQPVALDMLDDGSQTITVSERVYDLLHDQALVANLSDDAIAEALIEYGIKFLREKRQPQPTMPSDVRATIIDCLGEVREMLLREHAHDSGYGAPAIDAALAWLDAHAQEGTR